jgi:hypothetical protein
MLDRFDVGREAHSALSGDLKVACCALDESCLLEVLGQADGDLLCFAGIEVLQSLSYLPMQIRTFHRIQATVKVVLEEDMPEAIAGDSPICDRHHAFGEDKTVSAAELVAQVPECGSSLDAEDLRHRFGGEYLALDGGGAQHPQKQGRKPVDTRGNCSFSARW